MELELRCDIKAPEEAIHGLNGGYVPPPLAQGVNTGAAVHPCKTCKRPGHQSEICPVAAAQQRGEYEKCVSAGKPCGICGYADHSDQHHRLGAQDANYMLDNNKLKWRGGSLNLKKAYGQGVAQRGDQRQQVPPTSPASPDGANPKVPPLEQNCKTCSWGLTAAGPRAWGDAP